MNCRRGDDKDTDMVCWTDTSPSASWDFLCKEYAQTWVRSCPRTIQGATPTLHPPPHALAIAAPQQKLNSVRYARGMCMVCGCFRQPGAARTSVCYQRSAASWAPGFEMSSSIRVSHHQAIPCHNRVDRKL